MKDNSITFRASFELVKHIDEYAKKNDMSRSKAIRHALESLLTAQRSKKQKVWNWFK